MAACNRTLGEGGGLVFRKNWTDQQIDDELRENGLRIDVNRHGFILEKLLGFEFDVSRRVARGKFVVSNEFADSTGQLVTGVASYIAESIGSYAGGRASRTNRIAGVELNVNNLHPAYVGQEVTVTANLLKKNSKIQTWEVKFETEDLREPSSTPEAQGERSCETVLVALSRFTLLEHNFATEQTQKMSLERTSLSSKL